MSTTSNTDATSPRAPEFIAYTVRDREGKKAVWTRIGAAWKHGDGKGFNIQLDAFPVDGKISMREFSEKQD